jgi:tetratricopeptide (TPR) repeat protein
MSHRTLSIALGCSLLCATFAPAIDVVVRRGSEDQRDGGTITKVTRTEVTVTKQVGGDTVIPVNEIDYIEWEGAPASMALGRSALAAGQLEVARKQIEEALQESAGSSNTNLRADLDYLLARVTAEEAFVDAAKIPAAIETLKSFVSGNRDHYRGYDAQLALGDLAIAGEDVTTAISAFSALQTAPWKDFQMAAQIGNGRALLVQGNADGAKAEFDAVAGMDATTPAEKSRRMQALLGQAKCLQSKQDHSGAVTILADVIDQSTPADSRLQAEAYLRQGDCFVAMGANPKEAIMAYLHVDVIPAMSRESDLHAEALYHLSQLWQQVNQPERAREAAEALRTEYAESQWAKKLGG